MEHIMEMSSVRCQGSTQVERRRRQLLVNPIWNPFPPLRRGSLIVSLPQLENEWLWLLGIWPQTGGNIDYSSFQENHFKFMLPKCEEWQEGYNGSKMESLFYHTSRERILPLWSLVAACILHGYRRVPICQF